MQRKCNGGRYWTRTSDPYNVSKDQKFDNINNNKILAESKNPLSGQLSVSKKDTACLNDLAEIVTAWPQLPDAIKIGIVAMVKACGYGDRYPE